MEIKQTDNLYLREAVGDIESEGLKIAITIPPHSLHFIFKDGTQYRVPITSIAADVIDRHEDRGKQK